MFDQAPVSSLALSDRPVDGRKGHPVEFQCLNQDGEATSHYDAQTILVWIINILNIGCIFEFHLHDWFPKTQTEGLLFCTMVHSKETTAYKVTGLLNTQVKQISCVSRWLG